MPKHTDFSKWSDFEGFYLTAETISVELRGTSATNLLKNMNVGSTGGNPFSSGLAIDCLEYFQAWKWDDPKGDIIEFLASLLEFMGASDQYIKIASMEDSAQSMTLVTDKLLRSDQRIGDEVVIALACSELLHTGKLDKRLKALALGAIRRERIPEVIQRNKRLVNVQTRQTILDEVQSILVDH
jgi:uncharacterized protein YfeS